MTEQQQQTTTAYATFAHIEFMGHLSFDAWVESVDIFGVTLIAVDPIKDDGTQGKRRLFSPSALYSFEPMEEEEIRLLVERRRQWAARRQQVMRPPQLEEAPPSDTSDHDDSYDDDEYDEGT